MFDLHSLGWSSFQSLCLTITREVLGQTVAAFLDINDGGRDGAFVGEWTPKAQEALSGHFVIQCKFTSKPGGRLRISDLSDEFAKVRGLVKRDLCDSYVLMTNAGISGKQAEKIELLIKKAGAKHVLVLGATWINQQLLENKRLRMLVPRVYGLGDLSQILDERAYLQGRAILDSLRDDLAKVVITDAYRKAAKAINQHGFVMLVGEPAAGKTTIASLLGMSAVDQWNASILKLSSPSKVVEHWNPHEPSQFFWLDDAFGITQYEVSLTQEWNHILPQIRTMLQRGAKIVMTSRDYIYNRARADLKESAFPLLQESKVVIDVHKLSEFEKKQILYNHLKLGRQSSDFRHRIKPFLESIAAQERFIPETARRLADPVFTKDLTLDAYHLGRFVEFQEQFLSEVLRGLDRHSRAALALIYMRNDQLQSPLSLEPSEEEAIERLGSNMGGCVTALEALNGSLVLLSNASDDSVWRFKHPTIGDAYARILAQSPELLGIYLQGTAPERLIEQVTCGDVGIKNAVKIMKSLFPHLLARLSDFSASERYKTQWLSAWGAKWDLHNFLARRCSKEFLILYVEQNPEVLDEISRPSPYLDAGSKIALPALLHEHELLPEANRRAFVTTVSDYALKGEDLSALDDTDIRSLFKDDEYSALVENVRKTLLPRLGDVRASFQSNFRSDEAPEEFMEPLLTSFEILKKRFDEEPDAIELIDSEVQQAKDWILHHMPDDEQTRKPRDLETSDLSERPSETRSIFDDIDI